ncbi:MAG: DUF993 family protein [Planctomycetota bacterium]
MREVVTPPGLPPVVLEDGVGLGPGAPERTDDPPLPRRCYAASRVVMQDAYAGADRGADVAPWVDWDATLAQRAHLDAHGFGVAEAMDTAQRFELGWGVARELIERTAALAPANGFVAGASADHVGAAASLEELADAVAWQVDFIAARGGVPIVLPQLWLVEQRADEDAFVRFYARVAARSEAPFLVHWLGEAFVPAMAAYFPGRSARRVLDELPDRVLGIKLSLLDAAFETELRAAIAPQRQVVFTGDDWNFAELIAGEPGVAPSGAREIGGAPVEVGPFSHALLGVLDAIAAPASAALADLGRGDRVGYRARMEPCEALGRALFEAPTAHYKAGLAFVAWLAGRQSNPMLPLRLDEQRSVEHCLRVASLASRAGALPDATLAADRLRAFLAARGAS